MKLSLSIGLNYVQAPWMALSGCCEDARDWNDFLQAHGFFSSLIVDDGVSAFRATRAGILKAIMDMLSSAREGDLVVITYAGHGTQVKDSGGEADGLDECLVPPDASTSGLIKDDTLAEIFSAFKHLKIRLIFDCCHSGTMADLKYNYLPEGTVRENSETSAVLGDIICMSGCRDSQYSYEANGQGAFTGAALGLLWTTPSLLDDVLVLHKRIHNKVRARFPKQHVMLSSSLLITDQAPLV